jgi:drug/metabolite transporter (DMT)-like permease
LFAALAPFWGGLEPAGGLLFWGAVAWFVVFSTFGGYGFYWLNLKLSSVARVSSLIYLIPFRFIDGIMRACQRYTTHG